MRVRGDTRAFKAALDEPGLYTHLSKLETVRHGRQGHYRSPTVVTVEPDDVIQSARWFPEGCIVVCYARRDSGVVEEVLDAVVTDDVRALERVGANLANSRRAQEDVDLSAAVDEAVDAPALFDVRYGGKRLASHLFLPSGHDMDTTLVPFAGGNLDSDQFEIVEYPGETAERDPYDYVIVESQPALSDLESAVLDSIPSELSEVKLGEVSITPVVKVAVCMPMVVIGPTTSSFHDRLADVSMSSREVQRNGVRATPHELVARRREVFQEYGLL